MKKLLLSGTAIAGLALALSATPANAEINLGLSGHASAYGIFANQDDSAGDAAADTATFDLQRDIEVHFTGETVLDNGLTVGAEIQLEGKSGGQKTAAGAPAARAANDDQIDEAYLYMAGDWGRVNIGSENSAAYLLQVGAPAVDKNFDGIDPEFVPVNVGGNAAAAGLNYSMSIGGDNDRGDTEKLTYISPIFGGFQVGASYSPDVTEDTTIRAGMPADNVGGALEQGWSVGARWSGDFEGFGITAGAGYETADQEVSTVANDDRDVWNVGLNVAAGGFTVGAAYYDDNNGAANDGDTTTWTLGANYVTGPYTVGVSYLDSETEVGANAEDEVTRVLVGGSYAYGPGMDLNAAVHFYSLDDAASAAPDENDATIVTVGTTVKF